MTYSLKLLNIKKSVRWQDKYKEYLMVIKKKSNLLNLIDKSKVVFKFITSLFFLFLLFNNTYSTTYYVTPSGNDTNTGTKNQPWQTIQKAANTLTAGDTVFIQAGVYKEIITPQNSGTAGNYIVYMADSGDEVVIDGGTINLPDWDSGLFTLEDISYIKISGLKIMNAGPHNNNNGFYLDNTSFITLENNYIYNTISSGIGVWNSNNIIIDGNEVELACNDGEQECISVAKQIFLKSIIITFIMVGQELRAAKVYALKMVHRMGRFIKISSIIRERIEPVFTLMPGINTHPISKFTKTLSMIAALEFH